MKRPATKAVMFKFPVSEYNDIGKIANKHNLNTSEFIRYCVRSRVNEMPTKLSRKDIVSALIHNSIKWLR